MYDYNSAIMLRVMGSSISPTIPPLASCLAYENRREKSNSKTEPWDSPLQGALQQIQADPHPRTNVGFSIPTSSDGKCRNLPRCWSRRPSWSAACSPSSANAQVRT